jgi:hypothetical protein
MGISKIEVKDNHEAGKDKGDKVFKEEVPPED